MIKSSSSSSVGPVLVRFFSISAKALLKGVGVRGVEAVSRLDGVRGWGAVFGVEHNIEEGLTGDERTDVSRGNPDDEGVCGGCFKNCDGENAHEDG